MTIKRDGKHCALDIWGYEYEKSKLYLQIEAS